MASRTRSPLDGPGMGYGPPGGRDRRATPVVTVVLALCCLLLAVTLAAVLLRPAGQTAGPVVTVTAVPTAPGPTAAPGTAAPGTATPGTAAPATPSPTPVATETLGSDATPRTDVPAGVRETAATFLRGWRETDREARLALLQVSATDSLLDKLADTDPDKIPEVEPVGELNVVQATDYAAVADQRLSDDSIVRLQLVYEPASRHGWLVDAIAPLE